MDNSYTPLNDVKVFAKDESGKNSSSSSLESSLAPVQEMGPVQTHLAIQMTTYPTEEYKTTSENGLEEAVQETGLFHFNQQGQIKYQQATEEVGDKPTTGTPCYQHGEEAAYQPTTTEGQEDEPTAADQANPQLFPTDLSTSPPAIHNAEPLITEGQPATQPTTNQENPEDTKAKEPTESGTECGQSGQLTNQSGNPKTKECGPFTVTVASLINMLTVMSFCNLKTEHVKGKLTIHPNTVEKGSSNSSAKAQLRLAVSAKEKLKKHLVSKTKTCKVSVTTKVAEKGTGKVLATHENQLFQLTPQGIASCPCELITNQELGQSDTKKVDIFVAITSHVQDWEAKFEKYGDDYWYIT